MNEIRAATVLEAKRTAVTLVTSDGLRLVGELALPADRDPVGMLICLHPLPTQGGMMDSHLLKKASSRLPALARLAVLRFNTRHVVGAGDERGRHLAVAAAAPGPPTPTWTGGPRTAKR